MPSYFDQMGGEPVLRAIISRFVDRVFEDGMIGFFFARIDRQRIKDKEYEFAAAHLGAGVEYSGRPLQVAHGHHPIMGGHFMRRLQLLRETLAEFSVPGEIQDHWLQHNLGLQATITSVPGSECRNDVIEQRPVPPRPASRPLTLLKPGKP